MTKPGKVGNLKHQVKYRDEIIQLCELKTVLVGATKYNESAAAGQI